jgi:hypothetical protein
MQGGGVMPQITVTLDEMTYMDLVHNLPKGTKSAFVNRAVKRAINAVCGCEGIAMHKYAREGEVAAHAALNVILARRHEHQEDLKKWDIINGGEEE